MPTSSNPNKPRVIVDYKNITKDILELFSQRYPYGYEGEDVIKFKNAKGEMVKAVPFETAKAKYLIKISVEMDARIDAFLEDDEDSEEDSELGEADTPEEGDLDD